MSGLRKMFNLQNKAEKDAGSLAQSYESAKFYICFLSKLKNV